MCLSILFIFLGIQCNTDHETFLHHLQENDTGMLETQENCWGFQKARNFEQLKHIQIAFKVISNMLYKLTFRQTYVYQTCRPVREVPIHLRV